MTWLKLILHLIIGLTLAGTGIVLLLVQGLASPIAIAGIIVAAYLVAIPMSARIARAMGE